MIEIFLPPVSTAQQLSLSSSQQQILLLHLLLLHLLLPLPDDGAQLSAALLPLPLPVLLCFHDWPGQNSFLHIKYLCSFYHLVKEFLVSERHRQRIAGGSSDGFSRIIVRVTGWVKFNHCSGWKAILNMNSYGVAFLNVKSN